MQERGLETDLAHAIEILNLDRNFDDRSADLSIDLSMDWSMDLSIRRSAHRVLWHGRETLTHPTKALMDLD
jgi:hypothetical protein